MEPMIFDAYIELNTSELPACGSDLLKSISAYGADRAIVIPAAENVSDSTFESANAKLAEFCKNHPGKLFPFCRLQPKLGSAAVESLKTALENGFYGLFLAPEKEQFYIDHCVELFRVLEARQKPLLLVTQKHLIRNPRYWQGAIEKFPHIPFIFIHAGQDDYIQAAEMAAEFPNVYLETSALNRMRTEYLLRTAGSGKIVFGSGSPVSDGRIEKVKFEVLKALTPDIAGANLDALMGIPQPEERV